MKQIEIIQEPFKGLLVLKTKNFEDQRGDFQKIYSKELFHLLDLNPQIMEIYFSVNKKDVIRGMHFQLLPYAHDKIVYVSQGDIIDVVIDLRKESKTYGKFFSIHLKGKEGIFLYIPVGFAHGFKSIEDNTIVNYIQTSCYSPTHDAGIRYDSFGYDWEIKNPIISERDKFHPSLIEFNSPF